MLSVEAGFASKIKVVPRTAPLRILFRKGAFFVT